MALKKDEIVGILRSELVSAQGYDQDELASNRIEAQNYFYNRARGDELPGRSPIQSSDVSDMVEGVLSNIAPILTNETLIQFEAAGEQDEAGAQLESDFVSYMVNGQSMGYVEILSAVKDALLLRNGFIKVWIDETNEEENITDSGMMDYQIQARLDESDLVTTWKILDIEKTGDTNTVRWKKLTHIRELKVSSIPPDAIVFSPETESPFLQVCRFFAERKLLTASELLKMGYDESDIDDLPSIDGDTKTDAQARRQDSANTDTTAADPANRIIETWDIHTRIDENEDGIARLMHYHLSANTILMSEEADWIPYATGSAFIVPHRLYGLSLFDKLKSTQDSKTHFLRQWHDNAKRVNNARIIYNPLTTEEGDILVSRPGGAIRSRDPGNVGQVKTDDMGMSIRAALDYMDKIRTERAGASLDLAAGEMQLAAKNVGDAGVDRQMSVKESLAGMMAATLANTLIRETYLLVHMTLRAQMPGDLTAKLNGKWVQSNPSEWPERKKLNVLTGLTRGEKMQRVSALSTVIQQQLSFMQQGQDGIIVDQSGVFNAISDWSRASGLENIDQYWIDPSSDEAQAAAKAKGEQAQQAQQAQTEAGQAQMQLQEQIFAMQAQLKKYEHDTELVFKYADRQLNAEIEEAKIIGSATLDLEREQLRFQNASRSQEIASAG